MLFCSLPENYGGLSLDNFTVSSSEIIIQCCSQDLKRRGEFYLKLSNHANLSDFAFFVYIENSPSPWNVRGEFHTKRVNPPIPPPGCNTDHSSCQSAISGGRSIVHCSSIRLVNYLTENAESWVRQLRR